MSVFPNWRTFAVHQRRRRSGCIPTGYEMLLREASAEGVDFSTFQDDFDLDINLGQGQAAPLNNFGSVASEVQKKYPWVKFAERAFATGTEKIAFIDFMMSARRPVLISLALKPFSLDGWHIMPSVDATDDKYMLLEYVESDGTPWTHWIDKSDLAQIHDRFDGGKEVAYLADLGRPWAT